MNRSIAQASVIVALSVVAAGGIVVAAERAEKAEKPAKVGKAKPTTRPAYLDKEHAPRGKGWLPLFNGKDLSGWKTFPDDRPNSWKVEDGILVSTFKEGQHGRNLYTERKFDDFELYYEYQVPKNGNSGVFLRGQYEIQVMDDHGVPSDKPKDWGNGGIYGQKAPSKNVSKPAGEWQSGYAKVVGNKITVFINGQKVIDEFAAPAATHLYEELNIKEGEPTGPILLQGDHRPINYRHVMIKPLKK
ncbi:MAG: DUF1080 domain-containing protein [Planctomycetes bacterium]|nr:DUF1080 domain-containing protein [Planctomycetota bacterium]